MNLIAQIKEKEKISEPLFYRRYREAYRHGSRRITKN